MAASRRRPPPWWSRPEPMCSWRRRPWSKAVRQPTLRRLRQSVRPACARLRSYTAAGRVLSDLHIGAPGTTIAKASGDPNDPSASQVSFEAPGLGRRTVKLETAVVKSVGCDATGVKVKALAIRLLD